MILSNNCMLNGKIVKRPSLKLKEDGTIKLFIPKPVKPEIIAQKLKINIVYEDKNLIVIDKEPGIVVHPGAGNRDKTLVNALLSHCKNNLSGIY